MEAGGDTSNEANGSTGRYDGSAGQRRFGLSGRARWLISGVFFLTFVGYLLLLPSGVFDDPEAEPIPWEEWGVPGDPPLDRPLIREWFEESAAWSEVVRQQAVPGAEEALRKLRFEFDNLAAWEEEKAADWDVGAALPLLLAWAEAGIELAGVAERYFPQTIDDPFRQEGATEYHIVNFLDDSSVMARSFPLLLRLSVGGVDTGRSAEEWLLWSGRFAKGFRPVGAASGVDYLLSRNVSNIFLLLVQESLDAGLIHDVELIDELRIMLKEVADEDAHLLASALWRETRWPLADQNRSGRAWRDAGSGKGRWIFREYFQNWPQWTTPVIDWWILARMQQNRSFAMTESALFEFAAEMRKPFFDRTYAEDEEFSWKVLLDPRPNAISGRIGRFGWGTASEHLSRRHAALATEAAMLDVCLAILKWQATTANGGESLPRALADLVPDFLSAVPTDPFANKPFGYDPERGVLWSVGEDGVDHGGVVPEEWMPPVDPHREKGRLMDLWRMVGGH